MLVCVKLTSIILGFWWLICRWQGVVGSR